MQNLYLASQYQPTFDSFPEKEKLLEYKDVIQGIRDQLEPDRDLQKIDGEIVNIFLKDLRLILSFIINLINNYGFYKNVNNLNIIHKLLKNSNNQLLVALDILEEINLKGFDRKIKTQYYECLDECKGYLDEILQEFSALLA